MITIVFPDRETEKQALGFLIGRFSGRVLQTGEHLVPETVLEVLADRNILFSVKGKTTYEPKTKPPLPSGERAGVRVSFRRS